MPTKTGVIVIEGHVQGLSNTRELGKRGVPVWVVDTGNCVAKYSKYCQNFVQCPAFNSDELADFLIDLAQKNQLEGWMLLPSNDHAVYTIARNHERLSKFFQLLTGKVEQLDLIYDKVNLLELAQKSKVDFPFYQSKDKLESLDFETFDYPVITKGRAGLDFYKKLKTKVIISNSSSELKQNLKELSSKFPIEKTFTQNIIPFDKGNKTISVGCFANEGELLTFWMGAKKREHPLTFGTATLAESIYNEQLVEPSKNILKALNYSGICEIEFLHDPRNNTYNLIEINARTWLWVGLAADCGVPLVWLAYQKMNGLKMDLPKNYEKNVLWFNPYTNIAITLKGLLNGKVKWKEIKENFGKKKVNALFVSGDNKPGWMYFFLAFKIIQSR